MLRLRIAFPPLVASLLWCLPAVAAAEVLDWTDGPERPSPSMDSLGPNVKKAETYSERYTFRADLDDGGRLSFEFTVGNVGPGDGHGAVSVELERPGYDNYMFRRKVSDWRFSDRGFRLEIANTTVEAVRDDRFRLTHRHDGMSIDVVFERTLPMWQPGNGELTVDDKAFTLELIAPRADVTGKVETRKQSSSLRGTRSGIADHSTSLFLPYQLARRFSRHHDFHDDVFVAWREIQLLDEHGGETIVWLLVGYQGEIVFADASAEIDFMRMRQDPETDYRVPLQVHVTGSQGSDRATWRARGENLERRDLLADYGPLVRFLARTITHPYQYRLDADYSLEMTIQGVEATVRGRGEYSMDYFQ